MAEIMDKKSGPDWYKNELFIVAVILLVCMLLSWQGVFSYLDWKLFDSMVMRNRAVPEHRDSVVMVCVDQKTLDFFSEQYSFSWPLPRMFHAFLVEHLTNCGAKAVVFDVIFSEQDIDRSEVTSSESDDAFAAAIEASERVYLAVAGQDIPGTGPMSDEPPLYLDDNDAAPFIHFSDAPSYRSAVFPLRKFSGASSYLGIVNMIPEKDGIHRRYPVVSSLGDRLVPSLAYSVVRNVLDGDELRSHLLDRLDSPFVFDSEGKFYLNWYGSGGTGRGVDGQDAVFNYYSYAAVIASYFQQRNGEELVIDPEAFKDKIVIIGSNAPGLFDLKATPFTHENEYPGMEIHATAIENMLSGDYITKIPVWLVMLLLIAITAFLYAADRKFSNLRIFIAIFVILALFELSAAYFFLVTSKCLIAAADLLVTSLLVFGGLVIVGYFKETREKRVLRSHFGRYVNETVLREILANPNAVNFQGKTIKATIMATDIAGFTSISEKLPPDEVVSRLNDYLSDVSETLIDNGAFINKYIGDAILALYGAFEEPDHMKNACSAALRAKDIIDSKIAEAEGRGEDPLITRFGITTGEMTLGNIGSERKIEYTVIGDTVNTAFRLEGLNKFYRTRIIVGDNTRHGAGDDYDFRLLDELKVKGKATSEEVFELLGFAGQTDSKLLQWRDEFESALQLYRNREFHDAKAVFDRLGADGDPTSEVFAGRCERFIKDPPPPEWSGVWVMLRK